MNIITRHAPKAQMLILFNHSNQWKRAPRVNRALSDDWAARMAATAKARRAEKGIALPDQHNQPPTPPPGEPEPVRQPEHVQPALSGYAAMKAGDLALNDDLNYDPFSNDHQQEAQPEPEQPEQAKQEAPQQAEPEQATNHQAIKPEPAKRATQQQNRRKKGEKKKEQKLYRKEVKWMNKDYMIAAQMLFDDCITPKASDMKPTLSAGDRVVLVAIASYADDKGECFPTFDQLTERSGLSRDTVKRAIPKLEEADLIQVEHGKAAGEKNEVNKYKLKFPPIGMN